MVKKFGKIVIEDMTIDFEPTSIPPALPDTTSVKYQSPKALVMWIVGFLIQLQAKHYIPYTALNLLLKFLYTIFCILGRFSEFVSVMAAHFPATHQFTWFVVCPKCWKLYHYGECVISAGSRRSSMTCNHVRYPNHPYHSYRRECGYLLLKSVSLESRRNIIYLHKVYCYNSLQSSLQELLLRPGFHQSCQ